MILSNIKLISNNKDLPLALPTKKRKWAIKNNNNSGSTFALL